MRSPTPCYSAAPAHEPALDQKGERLLWVETAVADKLAAMRGPGESYSDLILLLPRSRRGNPLLTILR
jgi:hypothetical protein